MLKVEGKTNYMNILDYSTRARLIASLAKKGQNVTVEEAVLMTQHLTVYEVCRPDCTRYYLLRDHLQDMGAPLEYACWMASIDVWNHPTAWRCA